MTETTELASAVDTTSSAAESSTAATTKSSGLAGLKLAQLQALASQLGISGGSRMRKGDLVTAISAHRAGTSTTKAPAKASLGKGRLRPRKLRQWMPRLPGDQGQAAVPC